MEDDLSETGSQLSPQTPPHWRGQQVLQQLKAFYGEFSADRLDLLDSLYTADVEFRDPVHTLHGCLALRHYLRNMATSLHDYQMHYLDEVTSSNAVCLTWEMSYTHPRLKGGRPIVVRGMSHLKFTDKVYYHEDCYDLGALVYEHVPVLGFVTRALKHRMAS